MQFALPVGNPSAKVTKIRQSPATAQHIQRSNRKAQRAARGLRRVCGYRAGRAGYVRLYPRKRTCAVQLAMSALGQKRT
jgi:hypothetical protein